MIKIFYIAMLLTFISCNNYKKAVKTITESAVIKYDTLRIKDTIIIKQRYFDTTFISKKYHDTLFFNNKFMSLNFIKKGDTITLKTTIKKDTIIYTNALPYQKYFAEYKENNDRWIIYALLVMLFFQIILSIIKK